MSTKDGYTQGQWSIGYEYSPGPWTLDKSRMILAVCHTGELKAVCDNVRGSNPKQANANARLIAAAPDMLEALLATEEFNNTNAAAMRRTAIAKAIGEQS